MPSYVGRYAPSPTGALHFGSVIAAIGSYLDARAHRGRWLLRIDDLDAPRTAAGAVAAILRELERLGLEWDATPEYQSEHPRRYLEALETLSARGLSYPCACSRKDLLGCRVYPGTCRQGLAPGRSAHSRRLRVGQARISFQDQIQGRCESNLALDTGDFVIHRGDGIVAYHLATVLDDAAAGVSQVVRGADLLASTARQIYLHKCLDLPIPEYAHLPVALNAAGQKLSKQTHAAPSHRLDAVELWRRSLVFLGQTVPANLLDLNDLRTHAVGHWHLDQVPRERETGSWASH